MYFYEIMTLASILFGSKSSLSICQTHSPHLEQGLKVFTAPEEAHPKRSCVIQANVLFSASSCSSSPFSLLSPSSSSSSLISGATNERDIWIGAKNDDPEEEHEEEEEEEEDEEEEEEEGKVEDEEEDYNGRYRNRRWSERKKREFPPPIPLLARTENLPCHMPWILKRYYKEDGSLIIQEVRVKHHEFFRAHRENGRLTLQLVHLDEEQFYHSSCHDGGASSSPLSSSLSEEEEEEEEEQEEEEEDQNREGPDIKTASSHQLIHYGTYEDKIISSEEEEDEQQQQQQSEEIMKITRMESLILASSLPELSLISKREDGGRVSCLPNTKKSLFFRMPIPRPHIQLVS